MPKSKSECPKKSTSANPDLLIKSQSYKQQQKKKTTSPYFTFPKRKQTYLDKKYQTISKETALKIELCQPRQSKLRQVWVPAPLPNNFQQSHSSKVTQDLPQRRPQYIRIPFEPDRSPFYTNNMYQVKSPIIVPNKYKVMPPIMVDQIIAPAVQMPQIIQHVPQLYQVHLVPSENLYSIPIMQVQIPSVQTRRPSNLQQMINFQQNNLKQLEPGFINAPVYYLTNPLEDKPAYVSSKPPPEYNKQSQMTNNFLREFYQHDRPTSFAPANNLYLPSTIKKLNASLKKPSIIPNFSAIQRFFFNGFQRQI